MKSENEGGEGNDRMNFLRKLGENKNLIKTFCIHFFHDSFSNMMWLKSNFYWYDFMYSLLLSES